MMDIKVANEIIDFLTSEKNNWTIIVSSKKPILENQMQSYHHYGKWYYSTWFKKK
jgi:hypothetical protein